MQVCREGKREAWCLHASRGFSCLLNQACASPGTGQIYQVRQVSTPPVSWASFSTLPPTPPTGLCWWWPGSRYLRGRYPGSRYQHPRGSPRTAGPELVPVTRITPSALSGRWDTSCSSSLSHHSSSAGPRARAGRASGRGRGRLGGRRLVGSTQRGTPSSRPREQALEWGGTAPPPSALGGGPRLCWTSLGASTPGPPRAVGTFPVSDCK